MRFSRPSWFILTLGIFIIAFASLGIARGQQIFEQNQLSEELAVAKHRINQLQFDQLYPQQEKIEQQLSETTSQLEMARAKLSRTTQSIVASATLFNIAESCGVEIMEITSPGLNQDILEEVECSTLPITVEVEGDVLALISYVTRLNDDFDLGVVKSVDMDIPQEIEDEEEAEETEGESEEEVEEEKPSVTIFLLIYMYQGE